MNRRQIIGSPADAVTRDRFPGVWPLVRGESRFPDGRIEFPEVEKVGPGPVIAGGIPGNVLLALSAQP